MLTIVLEVKTDEENKVKFGKYKLPLENIADRARSTIRRQPSTSPAKKLLRRQPTAQHDYLKEIQDETAATWFLYRKAKSKNKFASNCMDMKETFASSNFFTPTKLSVESPSRSKFYDNPMGEAEKLNNKLYNQSLL